MRTRLRLILGALLATAGLRRGPPATRDAHANGAEFTTGDACARSRRLPGALRRRLIAVTALLALLTGVASVAPAAHAEVRGSWTCSTDDTAPSGCSAKSLAPMPTARYFLAATTGPDGRIYALGGYSLVSIATVEAYDPMTNSWTTVAPMPTIRYGLAATTGPDGRIYALGGDNRNGIALTTAEAYDPATNTWTTLAPMPTGRWGLAAATGRDGRIYAIGGTNASYRDTLEAYDPATNTWICSTDDTAPSGCSAKSLAPMPTARANLAAATGPDGRIYALGGYNNSGVLATVEAYDPATNSWTTLAPIPTARANLAAATGPDGRIYALGGYNGTGGGSGIHATVEAYDTATNAWTTVAPMPTARDYLAAATGADGRIYALGGTNTNGVITDTVEAYRVASPTTFFPCGPWSTMTSPNPGTYTNQLFGVAAISATDVWAVGWEGNQAGSPEYTLTQHWNSTSWSTISSPNKSNASYNTLQAVTAISTNDVWAVGYYWDNTTSEPLTLAEHWNGTSWSIVPSPNPEPESLFYGVSATAGNDVWAVGTSYNPSTNAPYTLIEHWNGSSWSVVPSPSTGYAIGNVLYSVAAVSSTDAWAVGEAPTTPTAPTTLAEHWNGISWSIVPTPSTGSVESHLYGASAAGTNSVWAVGYQYISSSQPEAMLAEHWNGTTWTATSNYTDGSNNVRLYSVATIPGTQQAVAVGYEQGTGSAQSLVLRWGGSGWSKMSMQAQSSLGNQLAGVAVIPSFSLWTVGSYIPTSTTSRLAPTGLRPPSYTTARVTPTWARRVGPSSGSPKEYTLIMHERGSQMAIACPV